MHAGRRRFPPGGCQEPLRLAVTECDWLCRPGGRRVRAERRLCTVGSYADRAISVFRLSRSARLGGWTPRFPMPRIAADTRVAITASSTAVCDQQTAEGASRRSRGAQHLGSATGRRPCPPESWWTTMRSSRRPGQDLSSGIVNGCGPKSPGSHRAVWGLIARPPVSPAGFPPVSRLPAGTLPFVRLPLVSLRPAFSGSFPSAVARFRFPLGFPPGSLSLGQSSR